MHFRGLQSLSAFCLLILVITGISNGFECSPGCDPNNGFCEKPGECRCRPGWQGATCNQCVPFPGCRHGSCEKAWQCVCEEGWVGSQCDVDIHPCSSKPCYNNSTCTETGEGGYFCVCARGYTGDNCHLRTGPCLTNGSPCQNEGTCTDDNGLAAHPSCLCPPGFSGDFCEIDADDCEPGPCANGGSCLDHGPSYTCLCPPGFTGPTCNATLPPCAGNPCANGGSCLDHGPSYTCLCPPGFTGPTCNATLPPCAGDPCANGGSCLSRGDGTARCLCPPGFTGPSCARRRAKPGRPAGGEDGHHPPRYSLPSHMFHKLAHPPERKMLKITMKEAAHAPGPLVTRSQVICFAVLGLLTCLVVLGTTGIIFFNRCETWMANAKYTQLVRQQRDYLLSGSNGEEHSVNIILPEKIKLTSYGNHYTSI